MSFPLLAALAALILACVPAFAQADSSETQYEVDVPNAGIREKKQSKPKTEKDSEATTSTGKPQTGPSESTGGDNNSEGEGEDESTQGVAAGNGNGNNNGGNNSGGNNGSPTGGNPTGSEGSGSVSQSEALPPTESGEQVSHTSGGSSPLVPILIAVAVLAAISIGAVIYRQRRQTGGGSGSPVSPNA